MPSAPSPDRDTRLLDTLAALTAIGMKMARAMEREVDEATGPLDPDLPMRFARVARAVRQSVALEARLADEERRVADRAADQRRAEALDKARAAKQAGFERKLTAAFLVDQSFQDVAQDKAELKSFRKGLGDWVVEGRDDERYNQKPIGEIVVDICRGLGLAPDPDQFPDEEGWAAQVRATYARLDDAPLPREPEPPSWRPLAEGEPLSPSTGWRRFREPS